MSAFVHLRLHTEFSLVDGLVRIEELAAAVAAAGMPAVAVTDQCNLFALVKFWRAAQAAGLKPIVGVDAWLRDPAERAEPARLTLLCMNLAGYRNLTRLVSRSYLEGQRRGFPMLERAWLEPGTVSGLIALSGAGEGDVGRHLGNGRIAEAHRAVRAWRELFGDRYYLEVQRTGRPDEEALIDGTLGLVRELSLPAVATNDVRFLRRTDFEAHEARVCIHDGTLLADPARRRRYSEQQYLKSPAEMAVLFADLPGLLEQSVEIARRCSFELKLGKSYLPEYPVPEGTTMAGLLRTETEQGLIARLAAQDAGLPQLRSVDRGEYAGRLARELEVICGMGFEGYFLIVADFIRWAREHAIPVGPGRGSGAGSLVAYVLGITDLDPLQHDLLFERFLNPERVSMPDFDVDFCTEGRDRVIDYVAAKYGRDRVSQIITYGTMAAKAVVRDVGRVLGHNYGWVDRIAKLIPFELEITLDKAIDKDEELRQLYRDDGEVRELIDLARSIEGITRNAGMHAGGVVIAPSVLTDFAPLFAEQGSTSVVTQFDKDDVEAAGLVKFDFLGLRTLTVIELAVRIVNQARAKSGEAPLDMARLPLDDQPTFALLKACRTTGVFQLESRGMKDLIRRLQPDRFEDIVALVALFRPGPLQSGMVEDFIERKHAPQGQKIDWLHPALEPVLRPTYGVILYQEQVMQIAQILAGYTLGSADLLRRAMGKKLAEEMGQQRSIFIGGATERGVPERQATHIFDLMEKFAGYGFNKSHSAAYAVLSYQTAWLKAHYPAAFIAAVLSSDIDKTDKVVVGIDDARVMGLEVLPPDVNASVHDFAVADERRIRYGLGAVKGVGESAVAAIVEARTAHGAFASLADFCQRVDLARVNRRCLEALLKAGCFDRIGVNRATLMAELPAALQLGEQQTRADTMGQVDLFGLTPAAPPRPEAKTAVLPEWPQAVRLAGERETLGFFMTGHPLDEYAHDLKYLAPGTIAELACARPPGGGKVEWHPSRVVTLAGLVLDIKKRGNRTSLVLDDGTGRLEVSLFDEVLQQHRDLIARDAILLVEGGLKWDEFIEGWRLAAKRLVPIDAAREAQARRLLLRWPAGTEPAGVLASLEAALRPVRGGRCQVAVYYAASAAHALLELGPDWSIRPTPAALEELARQFGPGGWRIVYHPRDQEELLKAWGAAGTPVSLPLKMAG
ncbi:MAG TPA: DNA polymerase III subunit alpha [Steroidobacteraceae bacterium]|nr:DNA polymerase III subunit alpha [Steroidobacteraceae bacterium]